MPNDKMDVLPDEDSGQELAFDKIPLQIGKSTTITMPEEQPQPQTQGKTESTLDESTTDSLKSSSTKSANTVTSKSEEDKVQPVVAALTKKVYKLKEENRVPQSRVNQMARQRRIVEQRYNDLYQKHQDTVQYLRRLQNQGVAIPSELTTKLESDFKILETVENQRYESRKDEADEWLGEEVKKYTSEGFTFPASFIREMVNIVQAEGLTTQDPVEAYQKAFTIWANDNIDVSEETIKAGISNQDGKVEEQSDSKDEAKQAETARQIAKTKATGVSKTKVTPSKPSKSEPSRWAVVDEETTW